MCVNARSMARQQHISADLKKFIKEQIQTAPKLEVLLLLHRQQSRSLPVAEVAGALDFETDTAHEQLTALQTLGLVESDADKSRYRYHPVNSTLSSIVDRLAIAYRKQRVCILSTILTEDSNKHQRFVEAFKLARSND